MPLIGVEGAAWRSVTLAGTESDCPSECPMHPITLFNRCAHSEGWYVCQRTMAGKWRVEFGRDGESAYFIAIRDTWVEAKRLFDLWQLRMLGVDVEG